MTRIGKLDFFGYYSETTEIEVYLPFEQNTPFLRTDKEVPFRFSKLILECDVFNKRKYTSKIVRGAPLFKFLLFTVTGITGE
jgi:hypothetical protein